MIMILYVALGVVLGFVILILLIWFWIKFKLRKFSSHLAEALSNMGGVGVPPLRIELEKNDQLEWTDSAKKKSTTQALESLGYRVAGSFDSYAPVHVKMLGFKNPDLPGFALIYEVDQANAFYLDLVCEMSDGTQITVSTAPDDGMDHPEFSKMIRMDHLNLSDESHVNVLHNRMLEEIAGKTVVDHTDKSFEEVFKKSWARTMDWRIERGGITTEEVMRVSAKEGRTDLSDEEIEMVKQPWKQEISYFIDEQIRKTYLKETNMSGDEWEETVDRIFIVHERSDVESIISELADTISYSDDFDEDDDLYERTETQLKSLFNSADSIMDGFHRALDLLPADKKYSLHGSTNHPWKGEIYLSPPYDDYEDEDY